MKTSLLLLLVSSATANFEEEDANRRHSLAQRLTRATSGAFSRVSLKTHDEEEAIVDTTTEEATVDTMTEDIVNQLERKLQTTTDSPTASPSYSPSYNPTANPTITAMPTTMVPTSSPTYVPTYGKSGKSRSIDSSKSGKGESKSGKGEGSSKSGKSEEPRPDYCEKAFDKAWEANLEADKEIAQTQKELKERCDFDTTDTKSSPFTPNLSCPFIYTPDTGFLDSEEDIVEFFENITDSNETSIAFWALQQYCDCEKGLNEMCATKIPDIPPITEESIDYCIFASIWNGDIEVDLIDTLDEEVVECGCTFVMTEKEEISECPGLDLGGNFDDPV